MALQKETNDRQKGEKKGEAESRRGRREEAFLIVDLVVNFTTILT